MDTLIEARNIIYNDGVERMTHNRTLSSYLEDGGSKTDGFLSTDS
jgi:hypothetical protein